MKKLIKNIRNNGDAGALLVNGVNALPFAGLALLLSADTAGIVFGIIFLVLGLFMWTVSFK